MIQTGGWDLYFRVEGAVMDVVYVVRPGDGNEELRYSLRSLRNLSHGRVFIAGHLPSWVAGVEHIDKGEPLPTKHLDALANLRAALADERVSDDFVLFNDDMFVMKRITNVPVLHRGPMAEVISSYPVGLYRNAMQRTKELLGWWGYTELLDYELHVPGVFDKAKLTEVLGRIAAEYRGVREETIARTHWRTVYGVVHHLGGSHARDVKVYEGDAPAGPVFLSTNDATFRGEPVGETIRARFAKPCRYEAKQDAVEDAPAA